MEEAVEGEIVEREELADVVVVNSCTVTNSADRELRRYLRNLPPVKKVVLTGCAAYTRGEEFYRQGLAHLVLGHKFKEKIGEFLDREGVILGDFDFINRRLVTRFTTTKGFVKIQEGCNFNCGYCIIPKVRGPSRSVPLPQVVEQVRLLVENGIREVVLTGINMGSYGEEWGGSLSQLIEKLVQIPGLKRLRLGSLEPTQLDRRLEELLESGILEKHLHIALQHTSNRMLRLMKRRNRVETTLPLFQRLAERGVALGTDFIVGHPGETEEVWREAVENFKRYPLTHLHIFRYSPREGTPSAKLPNRVAGDVARRRGEELKRIVAENNYRFRQRVEEPLLVHIEKVEGEVGSGYDQFFNRCFIKGEGVKRGDWVILKSYQVGKDGNYGEA